MVSLDDIRDLTLYRKPFFLPVDPMDKKRNSLIVLLTPNYKSSMLTMTAPYTVNRRYFESYYLERAVQRYISANEASSVEDRGEYIFEQTLTANQRNNLPDSDFGLPNQRRYPMPDESHVLAAIRFFNKVEKEYEEELAKNILKKIKKFNMAAKIKVGDNNRFKPYWEKSSLSKQAVDEFCYSDNTDFDYESYLNEYVSVNDALDTASRKIKGNAKVSIVFSGYKKDIDEASKFFEKNDCISGAFDKLQIDAPKKIKITVVNDINIDSGCNEDGIIIQSPKAFKDYKFVYKYEEYIKYMVQYYAIYYYNSKVYEQFAAPLATVLSGLADKKLEKARTTDDSLKAERVFKYIIDTYGIAQVKEIISQNSTMLFLKYSREYFKRPVRESELEIDELYPVCEAEETQTSPPPVQLGQVPESIKHIQTMATRLKRRMRNASVYKLNKILRDITRGNVGTEEKNTINSLEALKSGDISAIAAANTHSPEATKEQIEIWSNGDYVTEGNIMYLFESEKYDAQLKKALYADRIKNTKEVLNIYKTVRADLPFIRFAYADLNRYAKKNLFVDLSYYNEVFFRNIANINDEDKTNTPRLFNIYTELMCRLLDDQRLDTYKKKTFFIPILDWRHNNSMKMWMYRQDINPISVIYDMMRTGNYSKLKRLFGANDVVFFGGKNYFKINFAKDDFSNGSNLNKFIFCVKRIVAIGYNGLAEPDPKGELDNSPKGIAMDIIDKIERSQNIEINNISKFEKLNSDPDMISQGPSDIEITQNITAIKKQIVSSDDKADKVSVSTKGTMTAVDYKSNGTKIKKDVPVKQTVVTKTKDQSVADIHQVSSLDAVNKPSEDQNKDAVVDAVAKAASTSTDTDEALDKLNDEEFKAMVLALSNDSDDNLRVDKARASKIIQTEDEFHKKEVNGKSVQDLLKVNPNDNELPETDLHISSINKDWSQLKFINFDKDYDVDADIIKMLDAMQYWTFPIAVKDISVTDNSTSEDVLDLWKIDCVDFKGTRFTLKVDIPRFINGSNFLKLRGNEKTLMIQTTLIPIIKTDLTKCQIIGTGGYNKIFVEKFGERKGQSTLTAGRLIRALTKYAKSNGNIKIIEGDCSRICQKYELPIDYTDLAKYINSIESDNYKFYFNQDEFRLEYEVDDTKGIPLGVRKTYDPKTKQADYKIIYYSPEVKKYSSTVTGYIANILCEDQKFRSIYDTISVTGNKCSYSKASILNEHIPVIIICGYLEGLIKTMKKANIKYEFKQDIDRSLRYSDNFDFIRFKDGYLVFEVNYSSSLLMNGLKECDTESYSIKDVNNRIMYIDFLENYGGTLKTDGLENSYDCMLDPITKEILEMYKLPTDYVSVMIHANNLIADNKFVKHTDQSGRRWRRKELIAGYFYRALSGAYQMYANSVRHNRKGSKMEMRQDAVIKAILENNPSIADLSVNNIINDVECANTVTNKGLVGMNSERAYTIDTRGYDESMLNVLGMDTGFSGNVGINRQATIDANVTGGRGLVKTTTNPEDVSVTKTLTLTEGLIPFGSTHDDPSRTLMSYVQTSKHTIRCDTNDPMLITNGTDEAMPYFVSDIFAYKAKKDGKVVELVQNGPYKDNYMILEYKDGSHEYVNLSEEIKKNSDGGYYVPNS